VVAGAKDRKGASAKAVSRFSDVVIREHRAANIAKLPELLQRRSYEMTR
jgi:hypothetical protein